MKLTFKYVKIELANIGVNIGVNSILPRPYYRVNLIGGKEATARYSNDLACALQDGRKLAAERDKRHATAEQQSAQSVTATTGNCDSDYRCSNCSSPHVHIPANDNDRIVCNDCHMSSDRVAQDKYFAGKDAAIAKLHVGCDSDYHKRASNNPSGHRMNCFCGSATLENSCYCRGHQYMTEIKAEKLENFRAAVNELLRDYHMTNLYNHVKFRDAVVESASKILL